MSISVIGSETFQSMGDAIRELDAKAVIKSDFILLHGDCIVNLPLKEIRDEHKYVCIKIAFLLIFWFFTEKHDNVIKDAS